MATLPTNRDTGDTPIEHQDDHNELAIQHNKLDALVTGDTQGDIAIRSASGWIRLAKSATATDVLLAGASQPAWGAVSGPARMGWHLTRVAVQSIAASATTAISWDTEVQDTPGNFTPNATTGTSVTIPAGGDGLWSITTLIAMSSAVDFNVAFVQIQAGAMLFQQTDHDDVGALQPEVLTLAVTAIPLVAGNTITVNFRHQTTVSGTPTAQNVTGRLVAYRVGA